MEQRFLISMADRDERRLEIIERQVGRWVIGGRHKGTGCEAIYGNLVWVSLESRIT